MRLIDADALIAKCETISSAEWNNRAAPISWSHAYGSFIDEIDMAPTIDAVPVVHGRWEYNGILESVLSKCSVCGCLYGSSAFNYCPNCGAKMDLEVDDK